MTIARRYTVVYAAATLFTACTTRVDSRADSAAAARADDSIPPGALGRSVARGRAIVLATADSLPAHVGNALRCASCHLDAGTRSTAMPFIGVYARFPQYRSRAGTVQRLEDRINDCLERSLAGTALPLDSDAMRDMVAYMAWLSRGAVVGAGASGQGLRLGDATSGDTVAGAAVYQRDCARCHGTAGEGTAIAPPPWGPRSFTIGAGLARVRSATGFIRDNMPFDRPSTLSATDAVNVAAYITSRSRPDFADKALDWPNGDPPVDVAYPTAAGRRRVLHDTAAH